MTHIPRRAKFRPDLNGPPAMIVTIDGPAGAGKSTVARALARRLGFRFLDTGAMYRAVALAAIRRRIDWTRPDELARLAKEIDIEVDEQRVLLDGQDVTGFIRTRDVTAATRYAADNPAVRERLVALQRQFASRVEASNESTDSLGRPTRGTVTEGRDQGTVVFPDAECKFFLTASDEVRASRRLVDMNARGETASFETVLSEQSERDRNDAERAVGALRQADDAVEICTDGLSADEVVDRLETIARERMP